MALRSFQKRSFAFTIVELLIVFGILGLLAALMIPALGAWRERTVVKSAARDIESILKLARSKSLASEEGAKYGVLFYDGTTRYQLCKNPAYLCTLTCAFSCGVLASEYNMPLALSFCTTYTSSSELETTVTGLGVNPGVFFSKLTGEYENIDPSVTPAEGTIYFYNRNKITSPCGNSALLRTCLADKTCGGVVITKGGVIYEK